MNDQDNAILTRDDAAILINDIRKRSPIAAPEGSANAPILDSWIITRAFGRNGPPLFVAEGLISGGDGRFEAGRMVVTSVLEEIDGGPGVPQWIRTRNSVYRLGYPEYPVSPLYMVAAADDWTAALFLLAEMTGEHTLANADRDVLLALRAAADAPDWIGRRRQAADLAEVMLLQERHRLLDAWTLLAADPRYPVSASMATGLLTRDSGWQELATVSRAVKAWEAWARGDGIMPDREIDHIRQAHELGKAIICHEQAGTSPASLTNETAYVVVAQQETWEDAWLQAREALSKDVLTGVEEAVAGLTGRDRLDTVRRYTSASWKNGSLCSAHDLALLTILGTDPGNRSAVTEVCEALYALPPATAGVAPDRWNALLEVLSSGGAPPDAGDPFRSAHLVSVAGGPGSRDRSEEGDAGCDGVVVIEALGGTSHTISGKEVHKEFSRIVGQRLPVRKAFKLERARRRLADEFPHLAVQIDLLMAGLIEAGPIGIAPVLLVGEPGGGKSRLVRRLSEELQIYLHRFDGAGSFDNSFAGTSRRWSSGEHAVPVEAVRRSGIANPWILVDEIDKAGRSHTNGSLVDALNTFLEVENSRTYMDPFLQSTIDLSRVGYVLTANDTDPIPKPLLDRLRKIVLPRPGVEHLAQLARGIVRDLAVASPLGRPEWVSDLCDGELAIAESLWRGGSVRRLVRIVKAIVDNRERKPRN